MSLREEIVSILQEDFSLGLEVQHSQPDDAAQENRDLLLLNRAAAIREQEPEEAVKIIREILSRHSNDEHTRRGSQILAQTLFEMRRYEEADIAIQQALACGPPSFHALNTYGLIQGALGRYDEAEQLFRQAVVASKDDTQKRIALLNLSGVLDKARREQDSKAAIAEAHTYGENTHILLRQAYDHYDSENWQAAAHASRRVTELSPLDVEGWDVLGSSLYQMKQYEKAYEAYQQALSLRPGDADMLGRMAYAAAFSGRSKAEILALLDRAVVAGRNDADILALRAAASTGDEARQLAMKALEEDPTHWLARNVMSSLPVEEIGGVLKEISIPRERLQSLADSVGLSEEQALACCTAVTRVLMASANAELPVPRAMVEEMLSPYDSEQVRAVCAFLFEILRTHSLSRAGHILPVLENLIRHLSDGDQG